MNASSGRTSIGDQESWWMENLFPIGPGNLRAAYGPSAALYTTPGPTIRRIFFTNIDGVNPLGFMALDDGTIDQVNLNNGAVTSLGPVWTPVAPHYWLDIKLWQPNQFGNVAGQHGGVVIGSPKGLYAWDGATLTGPGQQPPLWLTNNQTVDSTGAPLVMPSGLAGIYALEIYKNRLWVMGQTVINFSAPANGGDFSSGSGGGAFPYYGDQLTVSYTDLQHSAGFLYVFGDSMTDGITDISLAQTQIQLANLTLVQTQFTNNNIDPQIGQRFFRPIGKWETMFAVWNGAGIYLLQGQSYAWASQKIVNLLRSLDPLPFEPTVAVGHVHGVKWMFFNGTFTDIWGVKRSMMLAWSGPQTQKWFVVSQGKNLTEISSYEQNSIITPYGTDGTSLYQLFAQPDPSLPKLLATKAYTASTVLTQMSALTVKSWKRLYLEWMDNGTGPDGPSITATQSTADGGIVNGREDIGFSLAPGTLGITPHPTFGAGISSWVDFKSLSPDFTIARLAITFDERTLYGA